MNGLQATNLVEILDEISPDEAGALEKYKIANNGAAYELNHFLRGHKGATAPDSAWIQSLDSAIRKSRTTQPVQLHRATWAEDFDPFVHEGVFCDPAYASSSLCETSLGHHFVSAFSNRPIKLLIGCPQGASLVHLELQDDKGESEHEFLLPRGSRYKIIAERTPISGTSAIAAVIGQNQMFYTKDFVQLRIIEVSLEIS